MGMKAVKTTLHELGEAVVRITLPQEKYSSAFVQFFSPACEGYAAQSIYVSLHDKEDVQRVKDFATVLLAACEERLKQDDINE